MSLTRPLSWLAALMAVVSLAVAAQAQDFAGADRSLPTSGSEFHPRFNPLPELDEFGTPDFQYFAPADIGDFGGIDPPNTGFYFTYDRMYINVDRPNGIPSFGDGTEGDFGWGNRFDGGYMTDEAIGWGFSASHLDGPNENLEARQERIDRFNDDDDPPGGGGEPVLVDRNPREYVLQQSINDVKFSSIELNRIWRRKQFHNGAVLEPFLGVRYMTFKDYGRRDNNTRYAQDLVTGDEIPPTAFRREGPYEDFFTDRTIHENNMLGGQLGLRLHKQAAHWLVSGEFRAFAVQNFQHYNHHFERTLTRYTGGEGSDVELEIHQESIDHDNNSEFVWGGEVRAEASYQLTRSISLRSGLMVTSFGQGIARGVFQRDGVLDPFPRRITINDQNVTMAGVTFGVSINR